MQGVLVVGVVGDGISEGFLRGLLKVEKSGFFVFFWAGFLVGGWEEDVGLGRKFEG